MPTVSVVADGKFDDTNYSMQPKCIGNCNNHDFDVQYNDMMTINKYKKQTNQQISNKIKE